MHRGHAERLMSLCEDALADAGLAWRDLGGIGVGIGPGNFTGVRIAVSAARGLALGLGVPAIGVTGLEALALDAEGPVRAALPAPRGQLYLQDFDAGTAASEMRQSGPDWPDGERRAIGDWPEPPPGVAAATCPEPEARIAATARIALGRLGTAQPRPAPVYLRAADAAPASDPPPLLLP